jgi:ATP-dependent Zn protease
VECGLSNLGIVDAENLPQNLMDEEVRRILAEREKATKALLEAYRPVLEDLSALLVQEENLDGAVFRARLAQVENALSNAG